MLWQDSKTRAVFVVSKQDALDPSGATVQEFDGAVYDNEIRFETPDFMHLRELDGQRRDWYRIVRDPPARPLRRRAGLGRRLYASPLAADRRRGGLDLRSGSETRPLAALLGRAPASRTAFRKLPRDSDAAWDRDRHRPRVPQRLRARNHPVGGKGGLARRTTCRSRSPACRCRRTGHSSCARLETGCGAHRLHVDLRLARTDRGADSPRVDDDPSAAATGH